MENRLRIIELSLDLSIEKGDEPYLKRFARAISKTLSTDDRPIRCVVTGGNPTNPKVEVAVMRGSATAENIVPVDIFRFNQRRWVNHTAFNVVFLVPTGIGAEIGGHAGDAGPTARLLSGCCDSLITHPNVGNAADINELTHNTHYVEGSVISQFLMGSIALRPVRANRILTLIERHPCLRYEDATINMLSAARAAAGFDCQQVAYLDPPLHMKSEYAGSGRASGVIEGFERLSALLRPYAGHYDAVALSTRIEVPKRFHHDYFCSDAKFVNPWGGIEAMLTHAVSLTHAVPSAHAPMMYSPEVHAIEHGRTDPRKAAEPVSITYLFSVLKGLHRSPGIVPIADTVPAPGRLTAADVHALVIPDGAVGLPTLAAFAQGIPVIAVRENRNTLRNTLSDWPQRPEKLITVDNYLEAAGVLTAMRQGVSLESLARPIRVAQVGLWKTKITS